MGKSNDGWMRPAELAKLLGVSRQHVGQEMKRGNLPTKVRFGVKLTRMPENKPKGGK